jgi:hypothetical protein
MAFPFSTTVLACSTLGLALSTLALAVAWRLRLRGESATTARTIEDLARRVGRLEALQAAPSDVPAPRSAFSERPQTAHRVDRPAASTLCPTLIEVPSLARTGARPGEVADASSELGRRFGPVWELAERGSSAESIARETGQPVGQVELILRLRSQVARASSPQGGKGDP